MNDIASDRSKLAEKCQDLLDCEVGGNPTGPNAGDTGIVEGHVLRTRCREKGNGNGRDGDSP